MEKGNTGEGATPRKRKLKFSERELEYLIEGVCRTHDKLFGKLSLKVPEQEKRRIWLRIKDKVNAVGVTHRSIDDLKKRWYDLRVRAKERIAERLKEARTTGGGPSTVQQNTPMEDMVEATIEPEAVSGVTQLDTSGAATTSQDAAGEESDDSTRLEIVDSPTDNEGEVTAPPTITPPHQRNAGHGCQAWSRWEGTRTQQAHLGQASPL